MAAQSCGAAASTYSVESFGRLLDLGRAADIQAMAQVTIRNAVHC